MPGPIETIHPIAGFADPFSSISHLLGALLALGFTVPLLRRAGGHPGRRVALGLFAASAVFLLAMSGLYHLWPHNTPGRIMLQRVDHAAILFLIAGSFTPPHIILFRGWWRWGMLALVWSVALAGLALTALFFNEIPAWFRFALYLGLGWLGALSGIKVWRAHGFACIQPVLAGGLAYTIGAVMDFTRWPVLVPGVIEAHELFHLAVLAGLACHWSFMLRIADGRLPGGGALDTGPADAVLVGR